jgi:hypothetical protein
VEDARRSKTKKVSSIVAPTSHDIRGIFSATLLANGITNQTPIYDSEERFSMTTSAMSQKQPPLRGSRL